MIELQDLLIYSGNSSSKKSTKQTTSNPGANPKEQMSHYKENSMYSKTSYIEQVRKSFEDIDVDDL